VPNASKRHCKGKLFDLVVTSIYGGDTAVNTSGITYTRGAGSPWWICNLPRPCQGISAEDARNTAHKDLRTSWEGTSERGGGRQSLDIRSQNAADG